MKKYRIKVEATHPEYEIDKRFTEGIECAGFLMVAFKENGKPKTEGQDGVSTSDLAFYIANGKAGGGPVSNTLLQAGEIARGILKAAEIREEYGQVSLLKRIDMHVDEMMHNDEIEGLEPGLFGEEDEDETSDTDD